MEYAFVEYVILAKHFDNRYLVSDDIGLDMDIAMQNNNLSREILA
jgi:hypothetical protein